MKLFISLSKTKTIENEYGKVEFDWKKDLREEEDDDYLPDGYSYNKVLELISITASKSKSGYGALLMKEFLATPEVAKAQLVMLDPVPFLDLKVTDARVEQLKVFYAKFGFRHNPKANRMWLVRKGKIADADLPT